MAFTSRSQICRFSRSGMYDTTTQFLKFRAGFAGTVGTKMSVLSIPATVLVVVVVVVVVPSSSSSFPCRSSDGIARSRNS